MKFIKNIWKRLKDQRAKNKEEWAKLTPTQKQQKQLISLFTFLIIIIIVYLTSRI